MPTLVQIDAWDPVTAAVVSLLACSHDNPTVCHLGGYTWWPTIAKLPTLRYDLFDGAFGGQITAPSSTISLQIEPWPYFGRYILADARFRLWHGSLGDPVGAYSLRFDGRISAQPKVQDGRAEIDFAVDDRWLDTSLLTLYAGTAGAEGPAALKGQAKPLALGAPRYVAGKLIDSVNSVFQVSAYGAVNGFEAALEKLARFPAPIGDYPTYAALIAATIPAGQWATAKAVGMARFGAPPTGQISFLLQGDAAGTDGWARTPGKVIRRLAALSGGAGRTDDISLNALDAARPYNVSIYLDAQATARDLIQKLAASVNAVAGVSWTGQLFVAPVAVGAATVTLAADGSSLPAVSSVQQIDIAAPFQKLAINAERAWTVHELADIAFTATVIDLGLYASATSYREGNVVNLSDGSRWLFVASSPASGSAPAAGNANWSRLTGPTAALYGDGTPIEVLKPAQAGADKTASNTAAGIAGQGALATQGSAVWGTQVVGSGKPNDFAGAVLDTRYVDQPPSYYYALGLGERQEFKAPNFSGSGSSGYGHLLSVTQWGDASGGPVKQVLTDSGNVIYERYSVTTAAWGAWVNNYNGNYMPAFGTDLLESRGGPLSTLANFKTTLGIASAVAGQGLLATLNSLANGSQYLSGFGNLSSLGSINLGSAYIYQSNGSTKVTDATAITSLGTAAAISGQGYFATGTDFANMSGATKPANNATVGAISGTNLYSAGGGIFRDADIQTVQGTAAAIYAQGAFATLSSAAYGSPLLTGFGGLSPLSSISLGSAYIRRADGSTTLTEPMTITSLGTAAGIVGQAATATSTDFAVLTGATKPANNATVGDNLVPNPTMAGSAPEWTQSSTAVIVAGSGSDPVTRYIKATGSGSIGTTAYFKIPANSPALYISFWLYRTAGQQITLDGSWADEAGNNVGQVRFTSFVGGTVGAWQLMRFTVTPPNRAVQVQIGSVTTSADETRFGGYHVNVSGLNADNTQLDPKVQSIDYASTSGDNLVQNSYLLTDGANWYNNGAVRTASSVNDPVPYFWRAPSINTSVFANNSNNPANFPAQAGRRYYFSALFRAANTSLQWQFTVYFYDKNISYLGGPAPAGYFNAANAWEEKSGYADAPANAMYIYVAVSLYGNTNGVSGNVDMGALRIALTERAATLGADANANIKDGANGGALVPRSNLLTNIGTAAGISGQGPLATSTNYNLLTGLPAVLAGLFSNGYVPAGFIQDQSQTRNVQTYFPATTGADQTGGATAAGIAGQGPLATSTSYGLLTSKPGFLNDLASDANGNPRLQAGYIARTSNDGTSGPNLYDYFPATTGSDRTANATSAAVSGQGRLATLNQVAIGSSVLVRADGSTQVTESLVVTQIGIASGFAGQGPSATLPAVTDLVYLSDTNTYTGSGPAGTGSASGGSGGSTTKNGGNIP